jgi:nucleoid DNA-binding protein
MDKSSFHSTKEEQRMANSKPATKSEIVKTLTESTGLSKKDVAGLFDGLTNIIKRELGKKGPGIVTIPGLVKLKVVNKPARKGGTKPNPFKPGEMMEVKPRPAYRAVKALPLKALKDAAK